MDSSAYSFSAASFRLWDPLLSSPQPLQEEAPNFLSPTTTQLGQINSGGNRIEVDIFPGSLSQQKSRPGEAAQVKPPLSSFTIPNSSELFSNLMSIIAKRPIMGENEWEDMAFKAISALHKEHNKEGRAAATLPSCEGGAGAAPVEAQGGKRMKITHLPDKASSGRSCGDGEDSGLRNAANRSATNCEDR